jgi:hypothetical protein
VATLLQFWLIDSGVFADEVAIRLVMRLRGGLLLGSQTVIESLRLISKRQGLRDGDVVIHSLKHGALTTLGRLGVRRWTLQWSEDTSP